ncbi:uncharacterized protein BXZ73DRAFT_24354, partial [Epithele typhae]|uniref:uncharacterized protein n=1 Tax=Epithele typhae TaxID=378194 RepID=UPI002007ED91
AALAASSDCTRTYVVKDGDWCDTISAANNVSTYQLAAVNPDIDDICGNLAIGSTLCLGTKAEDCTSTHVVIADDSCEAIQAAYSINSTMLTHNNPQIDDACDNLYIGEVLCVANEVVSTAATSISLVANVASTAATSVSLVTNAASTASTTSSAASVMITVVSDDDSIPFCDEL